jgi:hypothetical protein
MTKIRKSDWFFAFRFPGLQFRILLFKFRGSNMIQGNQTWQSGLTSLDKQPLYILQIPQFGIVIASFTQSQVQSLTQSGYGASLWGVGGWGT